MGLPCCLGDANGAAGTPPHMVYGIVLLLHAEMPNTIANTIFFPQHWGITAPGDVGHATPNS